MQQTLDFCSNCHQWYCQPPPISTMTPIRLRSEFTPRRLSLSDSNIAAVHCKAGKGAPYVKSLPILCADVAAAGRTGTMICCYLMWSRVCSRYRSVT